MSNSSRFGAWRKERIQQAEVARVWLSEAPRRSINASVSFQTACGGVRGDTPTLDRPQRDASRLCRQPALGPDDPPERHSKPPQAARILLARHTRHPRHFPAPSTPPLRRPVRPCCCRWIPERQRLHSGCSPVAACGCFCPFAAVVWA